eukprot:jgi/Botrbrau1/18996/Bobra.0100s0030.1
MHSATPIGAVVSLILEQYHSTHIECQAGSPSQRHSTQYTHCDLRYFRRGGNYVRKLSNFHPFLVCFTIR